MNSDFNMSSTITMRFKPLTAVCCLGDQFPIETESARKHKEEF